MNQTHDKQLLGALAPPSVEQLHFAFFHRFSTRPLPSLGKVTLYILQLDVLAHLSSQSLAERLLEKTRVLSVWVSGDWQQTEKTLFSL